MTMIVLKPDLTSLTHLDQLTATPLIKAVNDGTPDVQYPNSGPAVAGPVMPWAGGWNGGNNVRPNNATPGRSAGIPMGNGPVPGKK